MTLRLKAAGRPPHNPYASAQLKLPTPPAHIMALREHDYESFVKQLVSFFEKQKHHPEVCVGWWCGFPKHMSQLLTYLSEPFEEHRQTWHNFRNRVAIQIKNCRQCATKYHLAVAAWEISDELTSWPRSVAKRRLQSLLEWDCNRVLPTIVKGAHVDEADPAQRGVMMQCREAFLEALSSLRLCTYSKFCDALAQIFRKRTPARNAEDVMPFIRSLGFVPSGLLALCFHEAPPVQVWALRIYKDCHKLRTGLQQLIYLLRKAVKRIASLQQDLDQDTYTDEKEFQCDVAKLQSLWEGLSAILCTANKEALDSFFEEHSHSKIMKYVALAIASKFENVTKAAFKILRVFLRNLPYNVLFAPGSITLRELLDFTLVGVRRRSNSSATRESLLGLLDPIFVLARGHCDRGKVTRMYTECLRNLYDMAGISSLPRSNTHTETLGAIPGLEKCSTVRRLLLKVTSRFLLYFYRFSAPMLPIEDSTMISNIVLSALHEDSKSDWAWDLLRYVLLTDVLNIVRTVRPPNDIELISSTFLRKRMHIEARVEEETYLSDLMDIGEKSNPKRTWVGPLWRNILAGTHIRRLQNSVFRKEMSLMLDLHRLIGILDARMVEAMYREEEVRLHSQDSPTFLAIEKQKRRLTECIDTVHHIVSTRIQILINSDCTQSWFCLMPFHATHLLSSAKKDTSTNCMAAMRKAFDFKSTLSITNPSKLLAAAVLKNAEAAEMLVDGVQSGLCIMVAMGNMVSPRTYPSFFLWYRNLLSIGFSAQLRANSVSSWALAAVSSLSRIWKSYEIHVNEAEFREVFCQFFSQLREVWQAMYEDANRKSGERVEASAIQTATSGLISMHAIRDSAARSSWARTMVVIAPSWRMSEEHCAAMCKVVGLHAKRNHVANRLTFEECQLLVEKGNLREAQPILMAWEKSDKMKEMSTALNNKKFNNTTIDQFFPKKPTVQVSGNGFVRSQGNLNNVSARVPLGMPRGRFAPTRTKVRPLRGNGHISDFRKGILGDAPVRQKLRRGLQPETKPIKTPFQLQREKARELKAARVAAADSARVLQPLEVSDNPGGTSPYAEPVEKSGIDEQEAIPVVDPEEEERRACTLPADIRSVQHRDMDLVYQALVRSSEPTLPASARVDSSSRRFANVDQYVEFWEPLLTSECRAAIRGMVKEENNFASKFYNDPQSYRYCRTAFEVQEPPSNIGYFYNLRLRYCNDQGGLPREYDKDLSSSKFSIFQVEATDIVYLRIPPARCTERDGGPMTEALALVSTSKVEKGIHELVLQMCFENGLQNAPGKGRRIQISRITSLTTFQRQIEALWSISNLPDGLLWPILDPVYGLEVNDRVNSRHREVSTGVTSGPLAFISDLENVGTVNDSQADAIRTVLNSSGPLLQYHGTKRGEVFFKRNHGALTLIQGPPGTGKTSTIMNLISAFIMTSSNRSFPRIVRLAVDDICMRIRIPAIRVLVCAPSNAAVDEIMSRVIERGLTMPGGTKACPRVVRLGHGTTLEHLKRFELRKLARCSQEEDKPEADSKDTKARLEDRCRALQQVNEKISEVHNKRQELMDKEKDKAESAVHSSSEMESQIQSLTDQLTYLHDEKDSLKNNLSQVRKERKAQDQAKRSQKMQRMSKILNQSSLVFSTLSSSGHELMKTLGVNFDVIIIDEAAQSIEPETLIPMTLGGKGRSSPKFSHVVFVGDPQQLPATVISTNPLVVQQLRTSLFERLCPSSREQVRVLDVQYRMHPKISSFPNEHFYYGRIRDGPNVLEEQATKPFHYDAMKRFGPLSFFDTAMLNHTEKRTTRGSISNFAEAQFVVRILKSMIQSYASENFNNSIVLLSPYRQQVLLLEQMVRECTVLTSMNIEVSTIDGVQGREKPIVILSTVRGRNCNDIGFVNDQRRMNVALTRAKHSMLIVGNASVLSRTSVPWQGLIRHCHERSHLIYVPQDYNAILLGHGRVDMQLNRTAFRNSPPPLRSAPGCVPRNIIRPRKEDAIEAGEKNISHRKKEEHDNHEGAITRSSLPQLRSTPAFVPSSTIRSKKEDTTETGEKNVLHRKNADHGNHTGAINPSTGRGEEPRPNSRKRLSPEGSEVVAQNVKKGRGNGSSVKPLNAEDGDINIMKSRHRMDVVEPLFHKSSMDKDNLAEKRHHQTHDQRNVVSPSSERSKGLQAAPVKGRANIVAPEQYDVTRPQNQNPSINGKTAVRSVPLRFNMLISPGSENQKKAGTLQSKNVSALQSKEGPSQKVGDASQRPFAVWKKKTDPTPKDGSPFETNPAARFVPPESSKKVSFPFEKESARHFVPPQVSQVPGPSKTDRETKWEGRSTKRSKSATDHSPVPSTALRPGAYDAMPMHVDHVSKVNPPELRTLRLQSKPDILSRLGPKRSSIEKEGQELPRANSPWGGNPSNGHINEARPSTAWNPPRTDSGQLLRSRPLKTMRHDGSASIPLPVSKSFPGNNTAGIRKVNQKNARRQFVMGPGDKTINSSQYRNQGSMRSLHKADVNHRGFVKKTSLDSQRLQGSRLGKHGTTVSSRRVLSSEGSRHMNPVSKQNKRSLPTHRPFPQATSIVPSANGPRQNLAFPDYQTNNFGQRTSVPIQRLTQPAKRSDSKNKVTTRVQKPPNGGPLLRRLQADQEKTLNMLEPKRR